MKKILVKFGFMNKREDPIGDFFRNASSREQKKVFVSALKAAQEDQSKVFRKYDQMMREGKIPAHAR